jgi:hypothetical protein
VNNADADGHPILATDYNLFFHGRGLGHARDFPPEFRCQAAGRLRFLIFRPCSHKSGFGRCTGRWPQGLTSREMA